MTDTNESFILKTFEEKYGELRDPVTMTANTVTPGDGENDTVTDRQQRVDGFSQETFSESSVLLVGAGALGCQIGRGLVRKGVGELIICDEDHVAVSNLSRQLFYEEDVGKNKAVRLAQNLVKEGTCGTEITAVPLFFEDAVARGYEFEGVDMAVVAPDNDDARLAVAEHFLEEVPVVAVGLGMDASNGYAFIQTPEGACFRCFRGENAGGGDTCSPTPAALDPAMAVSGIVLYSIDSVLMDRYRDWNLYEVFLSGVPSPAARTVDRDERCPLCGEAAETTGGETA